MSRVDQFFARTCVDAADAERAGHNPYYPVITASQNGLLSIGSSRYYDCASNDYLGIAGHPKILQAIKEAVDRYGASMCATPIAAGTTDASISLAQRIAAMVGCEDGVLFSSCFQANTALFAMIVQKEDVVVVDHYAHASLIQGIRTAGCAIRPFKHNDVKHLERVLSACTNYPNVFVVSESVFSTEGSIAPFDEIVRLCSQFDAIPVIDDSHGIGVIGENGRGILDAKQVGRYGGIYTASLGKAFANSGGIIAGPKKFIEHVKYYCGGLTYSTSLIPAAVAGLTAALTVIENEFESRYDQLVKNTRRVRRSLDKAGKQPMVAEAPIISVQVGDTESTFRSAKQFYDRNILLTPFVPLSVPPGRGCLRIIAGAHLNDTATEAVCNAIEEMRQGDHR